MPDIQLILLLIYILSIFIFEKFRIVHTIMTMSIGFGYLLYDFYPGIVEESTLKLTFILTFLLYCSMLLYTVVLENKGD